MISAALRERRRVRHRLWAIAALAWLALIALTLTGLFHTVHEPATPHASVGMTGSGSIPHDPTHSAASAAPTSVIGAAIVMSALMVVAMMSPLLTMPIVHVRARSFPRRRFRSIGLFVLGYTALWTAVCVVMSTIFSFLRGRGIDTMWVIAATIASVAIWQMSPMKQAFLNRCHSRPALAGFGYAADRSALHFGARYAVGCIGSCWALMLLPLVADGWHVVAMAGASVWMAAERLSSPAAPRWELRFPRQPALAAAAWFGKWRRSRHADRACRLPIG